eukprot:SAG31_NODE_3612_length_4067_cov_13.889617_3_plen_220_part_00
MVRGKWNFSGFLVSDCGEIDDTAHHDGVTKPAAARLAVLAGNDMECTDDFPGDFQRYLAKDVAAEGGLHGELATAIDTAAGNILRVQIELGELDPPELVPYRSIGLERVDSAENQALAAEAAAKSLVLLQNRMGRLPIRAVGGGSSGLTVALIGPYSTLTDDLLGEADYSTFNLHVQHNSMEASLRRQRAVGKVTVAQGCSFEDNCVRVRLLQHASCFC